MRINSVPPATVTPPEVRPQVSGVASANPVNPQTPSATSTASPPSTAAQPRAEARIPETERRGNARRAGDRRTRQVAVLLDLRVRPRRTTRRRAGDAAPEAVDTKA